MFISRFIYSPAMGKGRELRTLMEERIKKSQGQGVDVSLSTSVFGEVPSLVVTYRYKDLAALEKDRARIMGDKDIQEYQGKLRSMATVKAELLEVIVPFPKS